MEDKPIRFYDDDGREINPDLIAKPSLCASCEKDNDASEETLCVLNRLDQQGEEEFQCYAYVAKHMPGEEFDDLNHKL
ncbi:MAG TPA: hypothetical protein VE890_18275 [Thermoguttaceae bacterium]|nr:hypothetical protein [Thermoguttaceae bacterium]